LAHHSPHYYVLRFFVDRARDHGFTVATAYASMLGSAVPDTEIDDTALDAMDELELIDITPARPV
jgi:hypothetical protein